MKSMTAALDPQQQPSVTKRLAKSFSRAARQYNEIATVQSRIAEYALSLVPNEPVANILDIGCGTGRHTAQLARFGEHITGLYIAPTMLELAAKHYPKLAFRYGNAEQLPFESLTQQLCFSSMALQWCESPAIALNEMYRVLQPGGIAVISVMVEPSFRKLDHAQQELGLQPTRNRFNTHMEWLNWARKAGFECLFNQQKVYLDAHDNALSLLRSISHVGASVQTSTTATSRLQRKHLSALEHILRAQSSQNLLEIDYQVSHFVLKKTENV